MRRHRLGFRRLAAALGLAGLLTGCVVVSPDGESEQAAFQEFGQANPECLAWTNWNRVCSRLNAAGDELHCNEAASRVRSSDIVCLSHRGNRTALFGFAANPVPRAFNRFCTEYRTIAGRRFCLKRAPDRPFSGYHISELRHPYCAVWGNEEGPYCTEDENNPDLPSCASMENAPGTGSPFSCLERNDAVMEQDGCSRLFYPALSHVRTPPRDVERIFTVAITGPQSPVANVFCRRWE